MKLEEAGRICIGGGGVVRESEEGASEAEAARARRGKIELEPGADLVVGLGAGARGEGRETEC